MYDITIFYRKGAEAGYLRPNTIQGRSWLIDNVKGLRINGRAMASSKELLTIIIQLNQTSLTTNWRND